MSFWDILGTLLIKPLQLLFEVVFVMANRVVGDPGLAIIALSLAMNFLVLPLYRRADAMQEEERETELRLHKGVAHIKKTFRGDERMMMLQTYYRQNNYKPTYVLKGATSLFLEIPFFIAAYAFLSNLELLHGVSFGPIRDLGAPDGLLTVAGVTVNVLPFLMTAINLVSCVIFTKGSLPKTKVQLYTMVLFFLVFLYTSPAGLVFYWTLNNLFSLVKTIFYKLRHAHIILGVLFSLAGIAAAVYGLFFYGQPTPRRLVFFIAAALVLQLPLLAVLCKGKVRLPEKLRGAQPSKKLFVSGCVFLAVLTGLLIPSAVIHASPQEFVNMTSFLHPAWYIVSALCFAVGTFVIWFGIFYSLAKPSVKALLDQCVWALCGIALVDYMFFGRSLGNLSAGLVFDNGLQFTTGQMLVNLAVVLAVFAVFSVNDGRPLVVSFWGSLGAGNMNRVTAELLYLEAAKEPFHHIHSVGSLGWQKMHEWVSGYGVDLRDHPSLDVREYIYDMADVMRAADLVICRAGASTLSELTALGVPAILVPSPNVTNHHQEKNAAVLGEHGAALVLPEEGLDGKRLFTEAAALLRDETRLAAMHEASLRLGVRDATERIYETVMALVK